MNDDQPTRPLGPGPSLFGSGATLPALADPAVPAASPAVRVGAVVGRYVLERELGRGGMGVVYAAHDPELDRRVAIKLLRTWASDGSEGRARLQREAQALARLAHPNVIAVFDVGAIGDDVFVAMELSAGGNLRAYQAGRPWREVVDAYLQAGRGLAAAHAAGLVHRDFKPDNVLVGGDGRMRVTDFGLVRVADAPAADAAPAVATATPTPAAPAAPARAASTSTPTPTSTLTEAGAVMGTPQYMAPEQMVGGAVGPAADQFAFAVALWQALHGETPFVPTELAARHRAIVAGARRPPTNREVPARLQRALERALAAEPAARWPTLDALLDELARARVVRRRWPIVAAVVGVAVAATAGALLVRGRAADRPCATAGTAGARLWSGARAQVERAFLATGAPYAAASFRVVDARLAALEGELTAAAVAACADTRVRHLQPEPVLAQREACLAVRRQRAAALVTRLAGIARPDLADVPGLLAGLPRVEDCADPQVLAGVTPRPTAPARAAALAALERRLGELAARRDAGPGAVPVDEARALAYPPIEAEALLVRAAAHRRAAGFDPARQDLIDAAAAATRGGDRERIAEAYLALLRLDADERGALDSAKTWGELAAAAVTALGDPLGKRIELAFGQSDLARAQGDPGRAVAALTPVLADPGVPVVERFELEGELALALVDQGRFEDAEATYARLAPAVAAELGPEHPYTLTIAASQATLWYHRGDFTRCRAAHAALVEARRRVLGPDDLAVAQSLEALAVCENKSGHSQDALGHLERAVEITRAARGADHPRTLSALSDLAGVYSHLGDHAHALTINQQLLAARERTLGVDHVDVAVSLVNTAIEAKHAGQLAQALAYQERAIAIFERALGRDHPNVAIALINYGEALRVAERIDDARAAFTRAGAIITTALGGAHPLMAHVAFGQGMCELARGRAAAAVEWLERAVAQRQGPDQDPNEQAEAELGLARALVAAGRDPRRARALAEHARATWLAAGPAFAADAAAAEAWLAARR